MRMCVSVVSTVKPMCWRFIFSLLRIVYIPLHVSSFTCPSSGGAKQAALGILRACDVSWLHQEWSGTLYIFRALLAHLQEAFHYSTRYIECVLCQLTEPGLAWSPAILVPPPDITRTNCTKYSLLAPPEDGQVML
jgi:hypothetical protein